MELKISVDEVKQICNLNDLKKTEILSSKFPIIEARLMDITQPKVYSRVVKETASEVVMTSFKHAFAYFVYAECLDFLNTNTSGSGIIKSTGFADSRTELISQYETEKRQNKLELKAYILLFPYLNTKGQKRYNDLKLWDDLQRAENEQAKNIILQEGKKCKIALI